jgi:AcrR family transcriptional regulator
MSRRHVLVEPDRIVPKVPSLWTDTIESHRREVRDAILATTARLVADNGIRAVTMSQIAEGAGIGRATLYKYFPDVEAILVAWHEGQVAAHLTALEELARRPGDPDRRLAAVLETYASMRNEHHGSELARLLHGGPHVSHAEQRLGDFIAELISEGARNGTFRADVSPDELAAFTLHALEAAGAATSKAAVRRLVAVILAGIQRDPGA